MLILCQMQGIESSSFLPSFLQRSLNGYHLPTEFDTESHCSSFLFPSTAITVCLSRAQCRTQSLAVHLFSLLQRSLYAYHVQIICDTESCGSSFFFIQSTIFVYISHVNCTGHRVPRSSFFFTSTIPVCLSQA